MRQEPAETGVFRDFLRAKSIFSHRAIRRRFRPSASFRKLLCGKMLRNKEFRLAHNPKEWWRTNVYRICR
jgi:hypothetical protein